MNDAIRPLTKLTLPGCHQTATLSRKVLPDLLKILRLPPITDGRGALAESISPSALADQSPHIAAANNSGTVYFTAPLYRKNLHYSVVPKPSNAKSAIEVMARYITNKHLSVTQIYS